MTEIPRQIPAEEVVREEDILVDEYHPLSLDWDENWEMVRQPDNSWIAKRKSLYGLNREINPQTGCG